MLEHRDWETGYDERALEALHDSGYILCGNCGDELGDTKVFVRLHGQPGLTSGPGLHPACALLSYHYCPHFVRFDPDSAFEVVRGPGHGMDFTDAGVSDYGHGWVDMSAVRTAGAQPVTMAEVRELAAADRRSVPRCPHTGPEPVAEPPQSR